MSDVVFEVEEGGEPRLLGEGEEPLEDQQVEQQAVVALPSWTPEEAASKAAEILTTGLLIGYVVRHQALPSMTTMQKLVCHPAELPSTGTAMVPFLNRFVPKGGVADVGISATAMLGEIGMAVGKRWKAMGEKPGRSAPEPASAPDQAAAPPESAAPTADTTGTYRMPRDLAHVVSRPRPDDSLAGVGMGAL